MAVTLTASRSSHVARFHTNSPLASTLTTVSLRRPSGAWFAQKRIVGGSKLTFWNWLKGARLSMPAALVVEIQPIGRGTTQALNGS